MDTSFSINLSIVENIYNDTYMELENKLQELTDTFTNGSTYKELKSSNILNFSNYIDSKKTSLLSINNSTNNVKNYLNDVIKNHYGIDNNLRELPSEIQDSNTLSILSSIKKISTYDNSYDEKSNKPILDYKSNFNVLISKSNLNFNESYTAVNVGDIHYDSKYQTYEDEEELHIATPSSSLYE